VLHFGPGNTGCIGTGFRYPTLLTSVSQLNDNLVNRLIVEYYVFKLNHIVSITSLEMLFLFHENRAPHVRSRIIGKPHDTRRHDFNTHKPIHCLHCYLCFTPRHIEQTKLSQNHSLSDYDQRQVVQRSLRHRQMCIVLACWVCDSVSLTCEEQCLQEAGLLSSSRAQTGCSYGVHAQALHFRRGLTLRLGT